MRQVSIFLLAAVGMTSVAAPVPKVRPHAYFPTTLGDKWEYAADGEKEVVSTAEVTKVTEKDGVITVEITTTDKGADAGTVSEYRVDKDGVSMTKAEGEELTPPRLDLKAKPAAEDKWDGPHEWKGSKYTLTTAVGKEEKVKVPAGEFAALPHAQTFALGDTEFPPRTTWYASGVGPVKIASKDGPTLVLLKYTAGKGK